MNSSVSVPAPRKKLSVSTINKHDRRPMTKEDRKIAFIFTPSLIHTTTFFNITATRHVFFLRQEHQLSMLVVDSSSSSSSKCWPSNWKREKKGYVSHSFVVAKVINGGEVEWKHPNQYSNWKDVEEFFISQIVCALGDNRRALHVCNKLNAILRSLAVL